MFNLLKNVRFLVAASGLIFAGWVPVNATDSTYVRFATSLGNIDVQLFPDEKPATVQNFMTYVNSGAYSNSIFHRISNLTNDGVVVLQGGGFYASTTLPLTALTTNAPVVNEPGTFSNVRGTLAMAKLGTDPNSATSQWYFNTVDNTALDSTSLDGGFTVFGQVANSASLAVMDTLAGEPTFTAGTTINGGALQELPLVNYTANSPLQLSNYEIVNSITTLTTTDYTTWATVPFSGKPAGDSAATATPQNDNTPNLLKYLCDITPERTMPATDVAKLPKAGTTTISGTTYLTLTYHQRPNLVGAFATVQTSSDLHTWAAPTTSTTSQTTATDGSGDSIVTVKVPTTPSTTAATVQYIRLQVSQ